MVKPDTPSVKSVEEICALPRKDIKADLRAVQERLNVVTAKRERLAGKLTSTTDEETRLTLQAQMLALALRLHRSAQSGVPSPAKTQQASVAATARRPETLSANALAIVRPGQGAHVPPQQVRPRLALLGIDRSERVIRTALRRWVASGL